VLDLKFIRENVDLVKRGAAAKREPVDIEAIVRSRNALDRVEVVVNGKVWRTFQAAGKKEFRLSEKFEPDVSSWIAVRAFEPAEETIVFGHTSPAYVLVNGRPVRSATDARAILAKVDQLIRYTETKAVFRKSEQKAETLELYRQARAVYERLADTAVR